MIRHSTAIQAVFAICLVFNLATAHAAGNAAVRPLAGDIMLRTLEGNDASLSKFKSRITIVNFWASWCFPCRYEMPRLQKIHDRFKADGLTVVAIAVDDKFDDARAYQSEKRFTFPMLFDGDGASKRAFGVDAVPETYIVGEDGKLVPFRDPKTGVVSTIINDPTVWDGQEIIDFLADLIVR